jgi:E3 ubiquitin-protein ligase UBR3
MLHFFFNFYLEYFFCKKILMIIVNNISDGNSSQKNKLNHSSFLQEIVFWTVRYEFPQKMVCLLLNLLPDASYKEALTEAFVMHYGCVARVLATTQDSDTLSNHIVHISVQLFSNEALATRMVDKLGLLRVMVSSLRRMMTKILIPSTLHGKIFDV